MRGAAQCCESDNYDPWDMTRSNSERLLGFQEKEGYREQCDNFMKPFV